MKFKRVILAAAVAAAFVAPIEANAMPAAIAAAAISTAISAGAAAIAGTLATFSFIGTFATAFALSAISGLLSKKQSQPSFQAEAQNRTVVIRSSVATRRIIYGQCESSGPLLYAESTTVGAKLYHHYIIPLADHECEEIGDVYFNDELVGSLDGSGNVTSGTFSGYARIKKHLGEPGQVADADLVSESAGLWTANHTGNGICYIYVRLHINSGVFLNGIPNIKAVVKGKKLYDPRVAGSPTVTAWSDNWALVVRDYLTSSYGLGCTDAEIDDTALIAAANIADELIELDAASPRTTQKRYTANGTVDLGDRPRDIMQQLLSAGAGSCVYAQGVYRVLAGAYSAPAVSINADWLAGGVKVRPRVARQDLYNAVRGTYSDPEKQWQPTDFPPQTNSTYETQDAGIRITRDIELPFTTNHYAAQRIAKLHLEKGRTSIAVQMTCNLKAFKVRVWDTVNVTLSLLGWTNKVFLVTGWALNERGTVDLQLQEELSASYDWVYTDATVLATPPDVSIAGGAPTYAYNTFDPTHKSNSIILTNGNLDAKSSTENDAWVSVLSLVFQTIGGSPTTKKYCEFTYTANLGVGFDELAFGIATADFTDFTAGNYIGITATSYSYATDATKRNNGSSVAYGADLTGGEVIGMAFDAESGALEFFVDNVSQGVAFTGITGSYCPAVSIFAADVNVATIFANFGATAFTYTPPAGYVGWNA